MALSKRQIASLIYHDQYDYPMTKEELKRWTLKGLIFKGQRAEKVRPYEAKDGYYFLRSRGKLVVLRQKREKESVKKMKLLSKHLWVFRWLPTVLMVGVTGSLAMNNASPTSDIDLMIITRKNTLWITRLITLILLITLKIPIRRAGDKDEKNKLCLNLWLDETALVWPEEDRNIFTAHEIAQVIPVINKQQAFEKFINSNLWVKKWWPNVIKTQKSFIRDPLVKARRPLYKILNFCAYRVQSWYMKPKMTNETVLTHRALFHPKKVFSNRS